MHLRDDNDDDDDDDGGGGGGGDQGGAGRPARRQPPPAAAPAVTPPDAPDPSGFTHPCGACGGQMRLFRRGARQALPVLVCAACDQSWPLPARAASFAGRAEKCALCGFLALDAKLENEGRTLTVCPKCFRAPPPEAGATLRGGELACSDCCAQACPLAEGIPGAGSPVAVCPRCAKPMHLSKTKDRSFYLACSRDCGAAIWLPRAVAAAAVLQDDRAFCPRCLERDGSRRRRVKVKLQRAKVVPGTPLEPTLCLFCDHTLDEIGLSRRNLQPAAQPLRPGQNAARGNLPNTAARGAPHNGPKRPRT